MKKYLGFLLVLLTSCSGPSDQTEDLTEEIDTMEGNGLVEYDLDKNRLSAVEFNNELSLIMELCIHSIDQVFQSDSSTIDLNVDNALFEMEIQLEKTKSLNFKGDGADFKSAIIKLVSYYRSELQGGFQDIIPFIKKKSISTDEQKELDEYDLKFAEEEKRLIKIIYAEQDSFALRNNIKLAD